MDNSSHVETVRRMFQVPQEFTPSYIHQCLGACEHTHTTLAEMITHYVHSNMSCLESVYLWSWLPWTMQYIPLFNIYLLRLSFLSFPLFGHFEPDLKKVPLDLHRSVQNCSEKLIVMRKQVVENIKMAQDQMVSRYNSKVVLLNFQVGDCNFNNGPKRTKTEITTQVWRTIYCTQHTYPTYGHFEGPHQKYFPQGCCTYENLRLKMAFVRKPSPMPYLRKYVISGFDPDCIND